MTDGEVTGRRYDPARSRPLPPPSSPPQPGRSSCPCRRRGSSPNCDCGSSPRRNAACSRSHRPSRRAGADNDCTVAVGSRGWTASIPACTASSAGSGTGSITCWRRCSRPAPVRWRPIAARWHCTPSRHRRVIPRHPSRCRSRSTGTPTSDASRSTASCSPPSTSSGSTGSRARRTTRTLVDSAATLGLAQLARGLDQGLVTNQVTLGSVRDALSTLGPAPGRRRRAALLLDERAPGSDRAESRPEIRLLRGGSRRRTPRPRPATRRHDRRARLPLRRRVSRGAHRHRVSGLGPAPESHRLRRRPPPRPPAHPRRLVGPLLHVGVVDCRSRRAHLASARHVTPGVTAMPNAARRGTP